MKTFLQFVIKEIYHITRDYRTLLVLIGMPLIQIVLFGFAIRTDINDAYIGILDKSNDYITQEIRNKILSSGYFKLNATLRNDSDIEEAFKSGKVDIVIVFGPQFAHNLLKEKQANVQILADASNPNLANLVKSYASSIILDYQRSLTESGGSMLIEPELKMLYNPELKSVFMFVPGLIAFILMLISALMTSIAITREKELGTMEVLLVSPLRPQVIVIGKVIPYIIIACANAVSVMVIALTVFHIPFQGSVLLFLFETGLLIITALSLGILISTIANTQQVAMMISLAGLLMPTMLLSGFIFPVENMPWLLRLLSNLIPAKWYLIITKGILLKGIGLELLWEETLVLGGMTLFFLFLSIKKFKVRIE